MRCYGEAHSNPFIDHCAVCMPHWGWLQSPRPNKDLAGLIMSRKNPCEDGEWISIYLSNLAGIDGDKYATVCEYHGNMITSRTKALAISAMRNPAEWCNKCEVAR